MTTPATAKLPETYTHAKRALERCADGLALMPKPSFKQPAAISSSVGKIFQNFRKQLGEAVPVLPFHHLLFLLLSMPVIWLACRTISSGK